MIATRPAASASGHISLDQLLLAYLCYAETPACPGGDGLTIDAMLSTYPHAAAAGHVPGPAELMRRHPELATELEAFFHQGKTR